MQTNIHHYVDDNNEDYVLKNFAPQSWCSADVLD